VSAPHGSALVGAVDIGTNSVLLLVAAASEGGLVAVVERATITRLGEGVDQSRRLDPAAVERTLACLADYGRELRALGVERIAAVGTSAMRDAAGGEAFRQRARDALGVEPRVIAGDEEARLTFFGGLSGLGVDPSRPVVLFDIGGGSTEFIRGSLGQGIARCLSVDVGSVRLTERIRPSDPPGPNDLERLESTITELLANADVPSFGQSTGGELPLVVGVAGTVTTLLAVSREIEPYDSAVVHGARLPVGELDAVVGRLASLPHTERSRLPGLSPKRADVIVAGGLLARALLRQLGASEVIVSDRGVRWGLAQGLAQLTASSAVDSRD
jgi:exopolyphosphatase / guanosine-5'-triphosphate,3'-diphosphate pyrophosphatase